MCLACAPAGVVAIQEMGGPVIPWRPGRTDAPSEASCPPDGRLPDAGKKAPHLRDIFYRMGFNDQEIVALSGAHALGRCHTDRSGFDGPWTRAPTTLSSEYFRLLLAEKWVPKQWSGPRQFVDERTKELMMLPSGEPASQLQPIHALEPMSASCRQLPSVSLYAVDSSSVPPSS